MSRESVNVAGAPAAIGPYVHAVKTGSLLFCSGQTPLDPESGELVGTNAAEQAEQVLKNVQTVLAGAGRSLSDVVKTTVYLTTMDDFAAMNEVYGKFFASEPPARTTVAVAALPKGALVEIEAIADLGD